jgi:putative FmdB family regulatory protein
MPVYEYRCEGCGGAHDRLLPHERVDDPGGCPDCGGRLARRFSRVAVRYQGWGFRATDGLVPDRPGGRNDFGAVQERAEKLSDTGEL